MTQHFILAKALSQLAFLHDTDICLKLLKKVSSYKYLGNHRLAKIKCSFKLVLEDFFYYPSKNAKAISCFKLLLPQSYPVINQGLLNKVAPL